MCVGIKIYSFADVGFKSLNCSTQLSLLTQRREALRDMLDKDKQEQQKLRQQFRRGDPGWRGGMGGLGMVGMRAFPSAASLTNSTNLQVPAGAGARNIGAPRAAPNMAEGKGRNSRVSVGARTPPQAAVATITPVASPGRYARPSAKWRTGADGGSIKHVPRGGSSGGGASSWWG